MTLAWERTIVPVGLLPGAAVLCDAVALQVASAAAALTEAPRALQQSGQGLTDASTLVVEVAELVRSLRALATQVEGLARQLRAAAAGFAAADAAGFAAANAAVMSVASTAAAAALAARLAAVPPYPRRPGEVELAGRSALQAADVVGAVTAEALLGLLPRRLAVAVAVVGDFVPDGPGWAAPAGPAVTGAGPRSGAALLQLVSRAQEVPGQLSLTHLTGTDRWIVALPGIHSFGEASDPQDLPGAVAAFGAGHTAYSRSVLAALVAAGVPVGSRLLLVGHSQGGIVAANLADDPAVSSRWPVTDVLTAGSPIAGVPIPPATRLLALDNVDDIVPSLDLSDDAGRADRTTIRFRDERGDIGGNHDLARTYAPFAASRGFTGDPAAQAWAAHAAPYLTGGPTSNQSFTLRDHPPSSAQGTETGRPTR